MSKLENLRKEAPGFAGRMLVSRDLFNKALRELEGAKGVRETPQEDLRFIEGVADLPYRSLRAFKCIPDPKTAVCACGREPNAADIVAHALRRSVHGKQTVRDALLGVETIFELSEGGREAGCLVCNRRIVMLSYWTNEYMYA